MDTREEKGLQIAAMSKVEKNRLGWKVPSQSGNGTYVVNLDHGHPFCTCPDFEKRQLPCKHIHAVEFVMKREENPDGTTTVTQAVRVTYNQDWHIYNEAQTHEQEHFVKLLRDLCDGIPQLESADNIQFPTLVNNTAKTFTINEVSADKAYSGRKNLHVVQAVGGTAYIPFMSHSTGMANKHSKFDGLWNQMWHFYNFNREAFLQHYHKRSNVETVFSMIKAKFGSAVRAKTPTAQVNEVLCKILCHNICVLIQSMYELGITPNFLN